MTRGRRAAAAGAPQERTSLKAEIAAGLRYAWSNVGIRTALLVIAAVDFAASGSMQVGLPTLAHGRFAAGAVGLGVLLGAWGAGATVGAAASGVIKPPRRIGWLIIGVCAWIGAGIVITGLVGSLIPAAADSRPGGHRHGPDQHLRHQLAAAANRSRDAGSRDVTGDDGFDRPRPDLPRRLRSDRGREPDSALCDCRGTHPAGLGGGGIEPDGPFFALRRVVRVA